LRLWRGVMQARAPTANQHFLLAGAFLPIHPPLFLFPRHILDDLEGPAKDITAYHLVAAELALRCRDFAGAEARFLEAGRLEPANHLHQLNLAVLRLQSTNAAVSADACATLERLRSNPNLGPIALRWLIAGRLGGRELATAERLSRELVGDPRSTMEDRLQYLNILYAARKPELEDYLAAQQHSSVTNASEVYSLSVWMIAHQRLESALQWLTNCPVKLRAEQPVPLALVNCYVAKKDWRALEAFLTSEKWSDL